ncbi:hypothetical protein SOVF_050970 [Spinacia oleracea]|nr:hypothetical protein SOVF_050970 [Spinacia oleracea]
MNINDNLGFFGMFKESFKIILTCPKIFIQITIAFILPQLCLSLAYLWISSSISPEWPMYWLISTGCSILSTIFNLLTISAIAYTVAYICTDQDFTFKKVVSVIPTVWKRLTITFLCNVCIVFAYFFICALVAGIFFTLFYVAKGGEEWIGMTTILLFIVMAILFVAGIFYMITIWQLANIVSVLENIRGFKALKRSKELIKGKMGTSFAITFVMLLWAIPNVVLVQKLAGFGTIERICLEFFMILFGTFITLYCLVIQTVFYFVCKSYHHESIDDDLGEYLPLKTGSMKIEDQV